MRNTGALRLLSQLSLPMLELLFVAPVPKSFEIMTPSTVGLCCSNLHLALLASFLPPGKNHVSSSKLSVLLPCCYDQLYHSPHTPQYEPNVFLCLLTYLNNSWRVELSWRYLKTVLHCLSNAGTFGIAQSEDFGLITFSFNCGRQDTAGAPNLRWAYLSKNPKV